MAEFTRSAAERIIREIRASEARPRNVRPFTRRWPIGGGEETATATTTTRYAMLRTDLEQGGTCQIQEYTQDVNGNWCTAGNTFTAYDPLGEYQGVENLTGCEFSDDPINAGLKILKRVTCGTFYCLLGQCAGGSGSGA